MENKEKKCECTACKNGMKTGHVQLNQILENQKSRNGGMPFSPEKEFLDKETKPYRPNGQNGIEVIVCPIHDNTHYCDFKIRGEGCTCKCTCKKESWEERFDEEFNFGFWKSDIKYTTPAVPVNKIKKFISQELSLAYTQGKEDMREEVLKGLPEKATERNSAKVSENYALTASECLGWNECLEQVKTNIEKI